MQECLLFQIIIKLLIIFIIIIKLLILLNSISNEYLKV